MNLTKLAWVFGVAIVSSVIELVYMFWSRSGAGHSYAQAGWKASGFGSGNYNLMKMGKGIYQKPSFQKPGGFHK